jgi:hypothetical protein
MDTAAMISEGRTFVPVRFIAEALGLTVGWDAGTKTVLLTTPKTEPTSPTPSETPKPPPAPTRGGSKIVGMWYNARSAGGGQTYSVAVFEENGRFFFVSYGPNGMDNFRGTYNVTEDGLQVTNFSRLKTSTSSSSDNKDLLRIVQNGSRDEVLALLDENHSYYASNNGWVSNSDTSAFFELSNDDALKTNLFLTGTIEFSRRK